MRSPSSTRFCSRKVRSWVAATPPVSMRWRRSGSAPASTLLNAWSCEEKFRIADSESIWPCRTVLLSRISAVVTSKLSLAVLMNELPLSMIVWRSLPVPPKAAPSSSTVVFRSSLSTDSTVSDRWVSRVSVAIGRRVSCSLDHRAVVQVRAVVALGLELDVLLTHGGPVADHGEGVGGDLVVAVVDVEHDVDALVGQLQLVHLADADAAVGDLASGEDAAGVGEAARSPCSCRRRTPCRAARSARPRRSRRAA